MKRRVKLSLKKDHDKQKRVRVTDCRRQEDRLRQATSDSVPLASASSLKTALDDGDSLEMQLASSSATDDCSKTLLGTLASGGDCEVSSSSQDYPMMSCGSVDCDDDALPSSESGHQMETEGGTEEDEGKVGGSIFCCPGGAPSNSEQELGLEDVDRVSDPISRNDDSDLCTQYELSNTAQYSLSSSDVAHFEDFSMPLRPKTNPSVKRQTSLLSFMSRTSNSAPSLNSKDNHRLPTPCSSLASCSTGKGKVAVPTHAQSDTEIQTFDSSRGSGRNSRAKRSCPFYKKIPGRLSLHVYLFAGIDSIMEKGERFENHLTFLPLKHVYTRTYIHTIDCTCTLYDSLLTLLQVLAFPSMLSAMVPYLIAPPTSCLTSTTITTWDLPGSSNNQSTAVR